MSQMCIRYSVHMVLYIYISLHAKMYILYHKDISVVTYINLYSDISVFHISRSSTVSTFPHVLRSRTGTGGPGAAVEHGHLQNHRRQGRGSVANVDR